MSTFAPDCLKSSTLRSLAKALKRASGELFDTALPLGQAQELLARTFDYPSWAAAIQRSQQNTISPPVLGPRFEVSSFELETSAQRYAFARLVGEFARLTLTDPSIFPSASWWGHIEVGCASCGDLAGSVICRELGGLAGSPAAGWTRLSEVLGSDIAPSTWTRAWKMMPAATLDMNLMSFPYPVAPPQLLSGTWAEHKQVWKAVVSSPKGGIMEAINLASLDQHVIVWVPGVAELNMAMADMKGETGSSDALGLAMGCWVEDTQEPVRMVVSPDREAMRRSALGTPESRSWLLYAIKRGVCDKRYPFYALLIKLAINFSEIGQIALGRYLLDLAGHMRWQGKSGADLLAQDLAPFDRSVAIHLHEMCSAASFSDAMAFVTLQVPFALIPSSELKIFLSIAERIGNHLTMRVPLVDSIKRIQKVNQNPIFAGSTQEQVWVDQMSKVCQERGSDGLRIWGIDLWKDSQPGLAILWGLIFSGGGDPGRELLSLSFIGSGVVTTEVT